jgi:excisionase family DNA binding protein
MSANRKPAAPVEGQTISRLLTIPEAAQVLSVAEVTVRLWLSKGRLPKVKLGRCVRIPAAAIEAFVQANTTPAR